MDSQPSPPQKSHSKNGSKVSSREGQANEEFDFDARVERDTGRRPSRVNTAEAGASPGLKRTASARKAGVGLVPKPSGLCADPLNWARWRKEVAFASLMLGSALIGILKTMLVSVNAVVATEFTVSYMAATALTGVPLIFGAFAGLKSQMLSQSIGKRGIYLGSSVLMLIGAVWNMHVSENYAEFMVSRIFQGIGWGMFEVLVAGSIDDMFFVHERLARHNAYHVISILFTWGSPILGGYVSQSTAGFRNQIMIVNIIQAFSIVFLFLATPETTFNRSSLQQPQSDPATLPGTGTTVLTSPPKSTFKLYLATLMLITPYSKSKFTVKKALRPLRALAAPSTILTTLLTAPLLATAFGLASSLSLIFSAMPTFLFPSRLGFLFILPVVFSLLTYSLAAFTTYMRTKPPHHLSDSGTKTLTTAGPGLIISTAGLLAFGLYTSAELMPNVIDNGTIFALDIVAVEISLKTVSALFGLMVSGAIVLSYSGNAYLMSLSASPSGLSEAELAGAHHVLKELVVGIWVIGMPMWVEGDMVLLVAAGLKNTSIALGVLGVVLGSSVGAVLWVKGGAVRGVDERVLGRREQDLQSGPGGVPLQRWKTNGSFFEA